MITFLERFVENMVVVYADGGSLHSFLNQAEVEPVRWLVLRYPVLLDAETLHKERRDPQRF